MNRNYHSKDTVTCNVNSNNIQVQNGTIILRNTWFWTPINSFGFVFSNSLYGFIQVVSRGF